MNIQIIGDEIHVDGQVVALLANRGVAATLMYRIVRGLDGVVLGDIYDDTGHLDGTATPSAPTGDERDPLLAHFSKLAQNGLLRLTDVCDTIHRHFDGETL